MSNKRERVAVEILRPTHKALGRYAKRRGLTITEAADALLKTGLGRAEALERAKGKARVPKVVVGAAVAESDKETAAAT